MDPKIRPLRNDASSLTDEDLQGLKDSVKGRVVIKDYASQTEYEAAIDRWNNVYIEQARIIVYAKDEADVLACIRYVDKHHLDVAVAGGRHSYHGASSGSSLVIDLKEMNEASVDKSSMTVTAQGGCVARDLEQPAEAEGLSVVFGAVNETGIGGLTLGGGVGWLTGQYGLTVDNLASARVALANGEVLNTSENENQDLFWAIRGGGPNFGICTEFKYRAHEQGPCFMQILLFPPDKLRACVSLANKLHTEAIEPANGKLQMMIILMSPPGAPLSPGFIIFYDGPEEKARSLAKPVFDLGPTKAMGGMTTYAKCTVIPPGLMPSGFDRYAASSAHMDYPLNEDLVLDVFDRYAQTVEKYGSQIQPSNCALDLRDYRKVASVPADATAYSARYNTALVVPNLRWQDPKLDQTMRSEASALTAYIREKVREAGIKAGVQTDGQRDVTAIYANVSGGAEKSKSVYGSNLPRLQALKKKYDPNLVWDKWYPVIPS